MNNYFSLHSPSYNSTQYNNSGNVRGYPNISANGVYYAVVSGNKSVPVSGTSTSTPIVGSIVTLINDARFAAGKGPVGFLNPILCSLSDVFNDITSGKNPGCHTPG